MKWPSITEGVTKATKKFFEEIFAGTEEGVSEDKTLAEEGKTKAVAAQSTANTAKTEAGEGKTKAETAQTTANEGKSKAEEALAAGGTGGATKAQILDSLNVVAAGEANRSVARARNGAEEAQFAALWAAVEEQSFTLAEATGMVASGGELFGSAKAKPYLTRAFVANNGNFRIATKIHYRKGVETEKYIDVGITSSVTLTDTTKWTSIGIKATGEAFYWVKGSAPTILASGLAEGVYLLTIAGDENGISMTLIKENREGTEGKVEMRAFATRAEVGEVKGIVLSNSDSRGASTGVSIGALGARLGGLAPLSGASAVGIEDQGVSRPIWTHDKNGERIRLELPKSFDSRTPPVAWIIHCHCLLTVAGESEKAETQPLETAGGFAAPTYKALLEAGFAVASSRMHQNTFGNTQALTDLGALYEYIRDHYPLAPIVLLGYSAGGTAAAMAMVQRKIPVAATVFVSAALNLLWLSEHHGEANQKEVVEAFRTAYGVNESFSNFAAEVTNKGLDPQAHEAVDYRGVPVMLLASPEDLLVPKAEEADKLAAKLEANGGSQRLLKRFTTSGEHGTSGNWSSAEIKKFIEEAVSL